MVTKEMMLMAVEEQSGSTLAVFALPSSQSQTGIVHYVFPCRPFVISNEGSYLKSVVGKNKGGGTKSKATMVSRWQVGPQHGLAYCLHGPSWPAYMTPHQLLHVFFILSKN
jgi:hypothetical protein